MARRPATAGARSAGTRERMVAGAADLLRRRGVAGSTLREVVRHTGTPRGSLAHHFPGGKSQLLAEAVLHARRHVSGPLAAALERHGPVRGLQAFAAQWRTTLEATDFQAGCPVMAIAIEHEAGGSGAAPPAPSRLLDSARAAFDEWVGLMAAALRSEGLSRARSRSLAVLVIAAFEGAIGMARAAHSLRPLDEVTRELVAILGAQLPARRRAAGREPAR